MTEKELSLHERACEIGRRIRRNESELIEILQEVDRFKLFKKFDCSSLFIYAVKHLGLDESVAYAAITVARKSTAVPELFTSIKEQRLSIAKANRIVSSLTNENVGALLEFAEMHSASEINRKVSTLTRKKIEISLDTLENLKRVKTLVGKSLDEALNQALEEFLQRHEPVKKAERALARPAARPKKPKSLCTYRVHKRTPLSAEEKHQVFVRDHGRCTHQDTMGQRCTNDRFLEIHHILPVSQGGTNELKNLTTLCSYHHDLAHQLSFPIDGQITWLRERRVAYGA